MVGIYQECSSSQVGIYRGVASQVGIYRGVASLGGIALYTPWYVLPCIHPGMYTLYHPGYTRLPTVLGDTAAAGDRRRAKAALRRKVV